MGVALGGLFSVVAFVAASCGPDPGGDTSGTTAGTDGATTGTTETTTGGDTDGTGVDVTGADTDTGAPTCPEPLQCRDAMCDPRDDPPQHNDDMQPIWDLFCTQCHFDAGETGGAAGDLDLSPSISYFNIVNVASNQSQSGQVRVDPGSPDASYLWHKINGTHLCPTPDGETEGMPPDSPLSEMSPADVALITRWICCGAAQ